MPEYKAVFLDGSVFDLSKKKGTVVLLNIWATWCGPCRYEIPELQALHKKHAGKGFEVIGVSIDHEGAGESVKEFVAEKKISYPIVLDPQAVLPAMFQATVIPTSVLVDRQGKIVWSHIGVVRAADPRLTGILKAALART